MRSSENNFSLQVRVLDLESRRLYLNKVTIMQEFYYEKFYRLKSNSQLNVY